MYFYLLGERMLGNRRKAMLVSTVIVKVNTNLEVQEKKTFLSSVGQKCGVYLLRLTSKAI